MIRKIAALALVLSLLAFPARAALKAVAGGSSGSGMADLVDDTSPQLGGDLDTNTHDIQFTNGKGLKGGTTAADTWVMKVYDVNDTTFRTFCTGTAGNTPAFDCAAPAGGTLSITATAFSGPLTGNVTGNLTGAVTGNASTATALAANGSNCSAGQFPLGVDASGASESCTALPTTIAGTANQITASAATGAITLSTPQDIATGSSPQFAGLNVGAATDTTITRTGAGDIAVEGNGIYRAGGTDVPVADGGTGSSTAAGAATNLGLGTGDSPQFTAVNVGHASDTTITRTGAGDIAVEGNGIYRSGGTDVALADQYIEKCWAASDQTTTITAATDLVTQYPFPAAFTITDVYADAGTAPTGTMTIDINEAGTTILSTKLTIDANEFNGGSSGAQGTAATAAVISDASFAANAKLTVDVDSTTGGKALEVCIRGHY